MNFTFIKFRYGLNVRKLGVVLALLWIACWLPQAGWCGEAASLGSTVQGIKDRGVLRCGVEQNTLTMSAMDRDGEWRGFMVDLCHALGVALLGTTQDVEIIEVNKHLRYEALKGNAYDVLMSNSTWTLTRETALGVRFVTPYLFDGQGFLAHLKQGRTRLSAYDKANICVLDSTTSLTNLKALLAQHYPHFTLTSFVTLERMRESFFSGNCDMLSSDRLVLASEQLVRGGEQGAYHILEDIISREPLGPYVRQGDEQWFSLLRWLVQGLLLAEHKGVTRDNVDKLAGTTEDREIQHLLGVVGNAHQALGVDAQWMRRVIRVVGNFEEIYQRNLGALAQLGVRRGYNGLWYKGGLHYVPPFQ
ncbi:amino acid ABC transporter substrate-binding protein, PAAT family [Magnetococcus marinus MC-1]|uniref:Amino acid ABC transporter substrate-binding protein, PAAT family n=1 Tax=Magnetococcus marinus (strain ATCC BAA-1437 / JCM 17883 / MC-1) TaxID=156889 RepID=A0LA16_MAGMM|nr:transporter substrate-binding domain-containing protein [Magnetococcus marinus]ABK44809.1 amino acid ABC transporter substrate-binding protein, PAAT family [Magnetococcus marinus MC-1]